MRFSDIHGIGATNMQPIYDLYRVKLAHASNPDIDGGYWYGKPLGKNPELVPCTSLDRAKQIVAHYISNHGLGGGNWTGGQVQQLIGMRWTHIGRIAYNGRFFEGE
jgi:hypothetical protein